MCSLARSNTLKKSSNEPTLWPSPTGFSWRSSRHSASRPKRSPSSPNCSKAHLRHVRRFAADVNESASAADALQPSFVTTYRRATLLLPQSSVRVTIDAHYLGVAGCLGVGGSLSVDRSLGFGGNLGVGGNPEFAHQPASTHLGGEIIVETKSAGRPSAVDRALWQARCRPTRISKYTTGLAALRPDLPSNRWHRTLDRHFEVTRP
ncbi:MAG: VTC domain-containing protein [Actinobacteria bacterium]|nr:VTC domain-containing protein [Actinomycetota bacterium]